MGDAFREAGFGIPTPTRSHLVESEDREESQLQQLENQVENDGGGGWEYLSLVWKLKLRHSDKVLKHGLTLLNDPNKHSALGPDGASRIRNLPPEEFCKQRFVIAKASEAGFGNEMYKILTAASLSVILNWSLIIGQTRGKYPFGEYIKYTNTAFTLNEVKYLWRQNGCLTTYGKHLVMRIDDFQRPLKTNVLCSNWREWEEPIIWFQNTTDAVAAQFFLKNVHVEMRKGAFELFGKPESSNRPNVFGELMRVLISPTEKVKQAVDLVIGVGPDPDITLHMWMLMNRARLIRNWRSNLYPKLPIRSPSGM